MIRVSPRAHGHEDRAGDPLDGLVNLFDLGIVLSVGFLLAALSSLKLASEFANGETTAPTSSPSDSITAPPGSKVSAVPTDGASVVGRGEPVGQVYRLKDGSLIYVIPPSGGVPGSRTTVQPAPSAGPSPSAGPTP